MKLHWSCPNVLLTFFLLFLFIDAQAQTFSYDKKPAVIPPLPEAAALGSYGQHNVNLSKGKVNLNIPIYELPYRDIRLPISLNYITGGIKVNDMATQVGLGWILNSGGVITRSVKGRADYNGIQQDLPPTGSTNLSSETKYWLMTSFKDSESDIYMFNFNGNSGSFFFDRNGNVRMSNMEQFKVVPIIGTNTPITGIIGFTIITNDGFKYIFETIETQSTCSSSTPGPELNDGDFSSWSCNAENYISSWYLTKIVSPKGAEMNFQYDSGYQPGYDVSETHKRYIIDDSQNHDVDYQTFKKQSTRSKLRITSDNVKRLKTITAGNYRIEFITGAARTDLPGAYTLGAIDVYNKTEKIKSFTFEYKYLSGRLILTKYNQVSVNNINDKISHQFLYDEGGMPSRLSYSQDHWGYYNGQNNTNLIPGRKIGSNTYTGANRDVNALTTGILSLNKIIYPTGGSSEYYYELNSAYTSFPVTNQITVGDYFTIYTYNGLPNITNWNYCDYLEESHKDFTVDINTPVDFYMSMPYVQPNDMNPPVRWELWDMDTNQQLLYNASFTLTSNNGNGVANYKASLALQINKHYRIKHIIKPCVYNRNISPYTFQYVYTKGVQTITETQDVNVGGLRIKNILNRDANGNVTNKKTYNYPESGHSSGYLPFYPVYYYKYQENFIAVRPPMSGEFSPVQRLVRGGCQVGSSSSIVLGSNNFDVSYAYVEEVENDSYKTLYNFTSALDVKDQLDLGNGSTLELVGGNYDNTFYENPYYNVVSNEWGRGLLKEKTIFKDNIALQKETNLYDLNFGTNSTNYGSESFLKVSCYNNDRSGGSPVYGPWTVYLTNNDSFGYDIYWYKTQNNHYKLLQKKTEEFSGANILKKETSYKYNLNNLELSKQTTVGSDGVVNEEYYRYPEDIIPNTTNTYTDDIANGYQKLLKQNIIVPVESYKKRNNLFVDAKVVTYDNILPVKRALWNMAKNDLSSYASLQFNGGVIAFDPKLKKEVSFQYDNSQGNLISIIPTDAPSTSYLWGYNSEYPTAEVNNAQVKDILFEDFEDATGTGISTSSSHTGNNSKTNGYSKSLTGLTNGKYILSYWRETAGIWSEVVVDNIVVSNSTYAISINSTYHIDDIRFYPKEALMTTYAFTPLVGVISQVDSKGMASYYEYDGFQRLLNAKDEEKNIIKNYAYNYAPGTLPATSLFGNLVQSQAFNKNNCGSGYMGSAVTYTVAAGTYSGSTQAEANQLALNDITANGQNYANTNGTCTALPANPYIELEIKSGYVGADNHYYKVFSFVTYADAAKTIPMTVSSNYPVAYQQVSTTTYSDGSPSTTQILNKTISILAGSSFRDLTVDINTCGGVLPAMTAGTEAATAMQSDATGNQAQATGTKSETSGEATQPTTTQPAEATNTTNAVPPGGGGVTTCTSTDISLTTAVNPN